jgi:ABC-type branched-subunit amino acid transport system ATPase component
MADEALKVSGLESGYGPKQILYGIDLVAHEKEIVAIVGHNGAGKSTLLKALFGLIPVWKGEVYYNGEAVKNGSPGGESSQRDSIRSSGQPCFQRDDGA